MVRRPRQYRSGSGLKTFFVFALSVVCIIAREGRADDPAASTEAMVRIRAGQQAPQPISKYITGKFCEHLGTNIYNGMDAQILRNPTLAEYPFGTGQVTPDGIEAFQADQKQIVRQLREQAERIGWPEEELDRLAEAARRRAGLLVDSPRRPAVGTGEPGHRPTWRTGAARADNRCRRGDRPMDLPAVASDAEVRVRDSCPLARSSLPVRIALLKRCEGSLCESGRAGVVWHVEHLSRYPGG